jgi:hypothetical protein
MQLKISDFPDHRTKIKLQLPLIDLNQNNLSIVINIL